MTAAWTDTPPATGRGANPATGRQVVMVMLASGAIGLLLGLTHPSWHDALEPAQVLAGVVRYPVETPVSIYSIKTWTILHQLPALALRSGVAERTLTLALSGLAGMLSLQALAMFVLALSGDVAWAVLSSFFLYLTGATTGGVSYPVLLLGFPFTYGIIGLSYALLAIAFAGTGHVRTAALLFGFGPAVHATLGVLCLVALVVAAGLERKPARRCLLASWPYLAAGLAASLSSAAIHYLFSGINVRQTATALGASASFTHFWGQAHRRPFPLFGGSMLIVWANLGLSIFWMGAFKDDLTAGARTMLKILAASALVGIALSLAYWIPPRLTPNVVYALMPSRLLNLHIMTCMALLVGLAWRYRDNLWIQGTLTAIVVACSLLSVTEHSSYVGARIGMALGGPALIALVGLQRFGVGALSGPRWMLDTLRRTTLLTPAVILMLSIPFAVRPADGLADGSNDLVYQTVAGRPGLLLTAADIHQIQLRSRRPILLDGGALDGLPYIPEAARQADTILRRVYGIDTIQDVPEGEDIGGLWSDAGRTLWEARTIPEWQAIGREFGVTDVLTYAGWQLHLPVLIRSVDYTLYSIR